MHHHIKIILSISLYCLASLSLFSQTDTTQSVNNENKEPMMIFGDPEKLPEFSGGMDAQIKYISSKACYTERALKDGAEGTVFVSFMVDENGKIGNIKLLRGVHPDLDSICLKLIKEMPDWIPAMNGGKSIKYNYNLPLKFSCENFKRRSYIPWNYWETTGKRRFYKKCLTEYKKPKEECNCWYQFIKSNYNDSLLKDLDLHRIFNKQKCK